MSFPDENLTNCFFLVQKSPQAFIDYHTMLSLQERERERERESKYDYESTRYYQALF